jgi:tetratricopeptide (TPR) repeat protein
MIHRNPQFQRALILQQQHRYADAAAELRQVLAGDPHDAPAHALLALCLIEQKELKDATAEAQQAVGLAPDLPMAHYALAYALLRRGWLDEARSAAQECVRLDAFNPSHFALLAAIEMERRNWPAALEQAENGLALDPDHDWSTNLRAMALVKLGRRDEASAAMGEALSRNPENAVSQANQGWTLLHRGEHRQAMVHFKEALRLDPNLDWAKAGMVEALKSSFFLYRWLLYFFLWMARLGGRARWGVIIGAWVGYNMLDSVARRNPRAAPYLWPILYAYLAFVVMTWVAYPLLNLVLRVHRYGRYALSRDQTAMSNWVGGLLAAAVGLGIACYVTDSAGLLGLALVAALLVIPMSGAYACYRGWPRNVLFAAAAALALIGGAGSWMAYRGNIEPAQQLFNLFFLGILATSFATNALGQVRPRT